MIKSSILNIKKNTTHSIFKKPILSGGAPEINLFHTSSCLYVPVDDITPRIIDDSSRTEQLRELKEEALKGDLINSDLKSGLDEFKAAISGYNVVKEEVENEVEEVSAYINTSSDNEESFEDTMARFWVTKTDIEAKELLKYLKALKASSKERIDYESHLTISTEVLAINFKRLRCAMERGFECANIINITEFLKESKILVENSSGGQENLLTKITNLFYEFLERVGSTTIKEAAIIAAEKAENLKKYTENINMSVNNLSLLANVISYSLMLRAYNKYIYDKPLPAGLPKERLIKVQYVRYMTRAVLTSFILPVAVVGTSYFKNPLIETIFNIFPVPQPPQIVENSPNNARAFFLLTLLNKSIAPRWKLALIFLIIMFISILIFRVLDVTSATLPSGRVINFLNFSLIIFKTYWRVLIFSTIWVIIIIHALGLLLLWWAELNYVIWSQTLSAIPNQKYKYFIGTLIDICSNKEELNYYKSYFRAVILFFFIFFVFVLILTSVSFQIHWN